MCYLNFCLSAAELPSAVLIYELGCSNPYCAISNCKTLLYSESSGMMNSVPSGRYSFRAGWMTLSQIMQIARALPSCQFMRFIRRRAVFGVFLCSRGVLGTVLFRLFFFFV